MDEPHQEFCYRKPWPWVAALGTLALLALATGAWRALWGFPMAPELAGPSSASALIGLGLVLAGVALAAVRVALRHPAKIALSESAASFPRSRFSTQVVRLDWQQIESLRTADLGDEQQLELIWPEGQLRLFPAMLEKPEEFPALQAALVEQLRRVGIAVEERSAQERARRYRPQFSLAYLFLMITLVAVLLGVHRYAYHGYASDVWVELGITVLLLVAAPWATVRLPRAVWTFAVGFGLGFWLEGLAAVTWLSLGWLRFSSSPQPTGWFPLTAVVRNLASRSPALTWLSEGLGTYLVAATVAGVLGGLVALAVRRGVAWLVRRRPGAV